uniref:Chromophore lyase CpcS/CpeS n=1 Tax=Synarthrophyton chejuense TaxID=2485825 RepID=A0A3G3MFI8_9FLOR|nr:hypothetical protein [Synarthrophyton chejuense]AYR05588.1 hypothetical protein [Synarthrophyton chejuense]
MNQVSKLENIEGDWIVQSTNYSLLNYRLNTFKDKIYWKPVKYINKTIEKNLTSFITRYSITDYNIYIKQSKKQNLSQSLYHFFLYNDQNNKGHIIKLNGAGKIINQASFKYANKNYIYLTYKNKNYYIKELVYFVNPNLKIIKSIIKNKKKCIGISFSSEIRIN